MTKILMKLRPKLKNREKELCQQTLTIRLKIIVNSLRRKTENLLPSKKALSGRATTTFYK